MAEAGLDPPRSCLHWGKLDLQEAEALGGHFPEWSRFQDVPARLNPDGRFRNAYLDRVSQSHQLTPLVRRSAARFGPTPQHGGSS